MQKSKRKSLDIKRLVNLFRGFFKQTKNPQNKKSTIAQESILFIGQIASSIVSSLVAVWLAQDILRYNFPLVIIIGFALFFIFSTLIQTKWIRLKLSAYIVFITTLTIIIIEGVIIAGLYLKYSPPITYLVVDSTINTKDYFGQLIYNMEFAADVQPVNGKTGMRVYGGRLSGFYDCNDTMQLIKPMINKDYKEHLSNIIGTIYPSGSASMTVAIFQAIKSDLKQIRGPIKLIVITSGIDPNCEPKDDAIFQQIAKDIRETNRDNITISIISVGKISTNDINILSAYAVAFDGTHIHTPDPGSLSLLLLAPPSYTQNYFDLIQPTTHP